MPSNRTTATIVAFLALASSPVAAQSTQTAGRAGQMAGACGQPVALTYSLPLPLDEAQMAPLGLNLMRSEPAYVEFSLSAAARVVFRTEAGNEVADPYVAVYATTGAVLGQDDDSAGGYDALVDLQLDPGTYCAQVQPYSAAENGAVPVTLLMATGEAAAGIAARPGRGPADAAQLCADPSLVTDLGSVIGPGFGSIVQDATVASSGRADFTFTVTEATPFQADARGSALDTVLRLARDGGIVAENDDGTNMGTDSRIALEIQPGSYCLSVAGYDGAAGSAQIVLSDTPDEAILGDVTTACADPALVSDFGTPLAPGVGAVSQSASLAQGTRGAWSVEVTEPVTIQFDARSSAFDTVLSLIDEAGTLIEQNDDGPGTGIDSRITRELSPGRYCLAVEALGGGEGAFELAATDDPAPAPVDVTGIGLCTDPALTAETGQDLTAGFGTLALSATLAPGSRQDWRMTVVEPVRLRIDARSNEFDTVLKLADGTGYVLTENDDGPSGGTDSQIETELAAGTYCLSVEGFAGASGQTEVALTEIDGASDAPGTSGLGEPPPAPGSDTPIFELGALETFLQSNEVSEDRTKWMAFSLDAAADVRIDAVSVGGRFVVRLFDEAGTELGSAEGAAGLSPASLSQRLEAGRYLVGMTLDGVSGTMLRSVTITRQSTP